nr:DNA topoisomerase [uncultured Helicobacter sp.]
MKVNIEGKEYILNSASRFQSKNETEEFMKSLFKVKERKFLNKKKDSKTSPNKLFQATTLIQKTNLIFGFSSETTMSLAQNLYEKGLLPIIEWMWKTLVLNFIDEVQTMFGKKQQYIKGVNIKREYKAKLKLERQHKSHIVINLKRYKQ